MKNNEDENIEKLVDQMFANSRLERPSVDFTQTVMSEILASEKSKSLAYKPLLSGGAWLIIFACIVTVFIFSFINSEYATISLNFSVLNLDWIEKTFHDFQISSLTGYLILLATLMILIQTFILKKYLDKRFES